MNEKPESFLKKPLKGPWNLLVWVLILASTTFIALFTLEPLSIQKQNSWVYSLIGSIGIATGIVVAVIFLRWAFCRRNLRRTLFAIVCLATLVALFYAEENWRGKHAWEKYKREQEAKGERFDLKSIAPPSVPDDQNFAMAPLWVEEISGVMGIDRAKTWYGDKVAELGNTNFVRALEMPVEISSHGLEFTNGSGGWVKSQKEDLESRQEYYRKLAAVTNFFTIAPQRQTPAADVLLALSKYDSAIEKLRSASKLPYSRFPLGFTDDYPAGILLPHLATLKGCVKTLQLRSIAELQGGRQEKALGDIQLMFRLTESIRNEPIIISHLVRVSMLQIALQPIWEGLADHNWNDTQLAVLDADLAKLDFLADYEFSMRGERAFGVGIIDYIQRHRDQIDSIGDPELYDPPSNWGNSDFRQKMERLPARLAPRGWFDQNKVAIAHMHDVYFLPMVDVKTRVVSLSAFKRASEVLGQIKMTPYNWFTRLLLSSLNNLSQKSARAQSSTDLARIAIGLERYRLANGAFPETLDVLAPQFLSKVPHDIINGEPLHYRRNTDGQFILYSVGWNGTDDDGKIVLGKGSLPSVDIKQGDWVWKYPAK